MAALKENYDRENRVLSEKHGVAIEKLREEQQKYMEQNQQEMVQKYQTTLDGLNASHQREMETMQRFFQESRQSNSEMMNVMVQHIASLQTSIQETTRTASEANARAIQAMSNRPNNVPSFFSALEHIGVALIGGLLPSKSSKSSE